MLLPVLAVSKAVTKDVGLILTFVGIGLIANFIIVFVAVLVRGERQQNQQYRDR